MRLGRGGGGSGAGTKLRGAESALVPFCHVHNIQSLWSGISTQRVLVIHKGILMHSKTGLYLSTYTMRTSAEEQEKKIDEIVRWRLTATDPGLSVVSSLSTL